MSSVDASTFLPGAYSRRNPQGGSPNAAIPDVVPALIGRSLGKSVVVTDEAVTKGVLDAADSLAQSNIRRIIKISDTQGGPANYTLGSQFLLTGDTVDWSPSVFIPTPILDTPVVDTSAVTGTWGATGLHYFVMTALNGNGETVQSAEVSATVVSATDTVTLRWGRVPNATQYKIFESTTSGDYTGTALLTTIADGSVTEFVATTESVGAGSPPGANDADDEPVAAATYYVSYEYADYATLEGIPTRYTVLADVFNDHGIGSQVAQMAELAMSTQGRGNSAPAVWVAGVQLDAAASYQTALTNLESVSGEVLMIVMDKRTAQLDSDLRSHVVSMNGVEERRERVGVLWNDPNTAIGAAATPGTILYDAAQSASFDMFHVAPDSGDATALLGDTNGVYTETQAQGWHIASALVGMGAALPDAGTPFTRQPVLGLVNMEGTEYTDSQLKQLRDGGVMVIDNVNGNWRVLEGTTTLRTGLEEEKFPNISLADKSLAQLWRGVIDPAQSAVFNRRSLIGRKITDSLIEMVITRTKEALDIALARGLIRNYDSNSVTAVQGTGAPDPKTQINVEFTYVAYFPALVIISNRTFDVNG